MPLIPVIESHLKKLQAQQRKDKEQCGKSYLNSGYICRRTDGSLLREALLKVYRKHKRQSIADVLWTAFLFLCRWLAIPVLEPADLLPSLLRAKPGKDIFLRI